jgi:hypothetical protein
VDSNTRIDELLKLLAKRPYADRVIVFGSVARCSSSPRDLDIAVDLTSIRLDDDDWILRDEASPTSGYEKLLLIARRHYGWFDPFLMFRDTLLVRNAEATAWVVSLNRRAMRKSIHEEGVPLDRILMQRGLSDAINPVSAPAVVFPEEERPVSSNRVKQTL